MIEDLLSKHTDDQSNAVSEEDATNNIQSINVRVKILLIHYLIFILL